MNEAEKIIALVDSSEIGRKLRSARTRLQMTQAEAARIIGTGRTTMVAIENGSRRIQPDELLKLSIAYGRDIGKFLEVSRIDDLFPTLQFRGPTVPDALGNSAMEACFDELRSLSYDYYELELLLDEPLVKKYPSEYRLGKLRPSDLGEQIALEERQRLGLGDGPIPGLRKLLARDVGLRIFYLSAFPSEYSAIYAYSHRIGGCIAVNARHPIARCRFSLAHEYGHFLTSRSITDVCRDSDSWTREQIADQFAVHFLMPSTGIARRFMDLRNAKGQFTPYDLVDMAHYFGVSVEALSYRMEALRLIGTGILDVLRERGFKVNEVRKEIGLEESPESRQRLPVRHQLLASQALVVGLLSEGEFADLLEVDRVTARAIHHLLAN